jgi:phenylacetate-coenzyme A ligase PaaK-like adenylate-forming protein
LRGKGVMTSAGTLYAFMREKIEEVFRCRYSNYGSVSAIACEHPRKRGLWVAPWGCHVEIVDDRQPSSSREEGDILITSLANFAMR